eukprot:scaffold7044_cov80-Skeletonema_marinoi.AAC.1
MRPGVGGCWVGSMNVMVGSSIVLLAAMLSVMMLWRFVLRWLRSTYGQKTLSHHGRRTRESHRPRPLSEAECRRPPVASCNRIEYSLMP